MSFTVYVPGMNRGPTPKPALAAGGIFGGTMRIDHATRLSPRRLLVGSDCTSFPVESRTSSFMSPKMCRFCR